MPWEATTVIEQRVQFIRDYQHQVMSGLVTMSALCHEYGIARKTGYKFVRHHREQGWAGVADRSRAPRSGPHWTPDRVCEAVVTVRRENPDWGANKIVDFLRDRDPDLVWPAVSTAHQILRRAGLINRQSRPRRCPPPRRPLPQPLAPNELWTADFKGQFRTRDRRYCYPLTVADSFSRYLLGCRALPGNTFELTWPIFERLFREYGLPEAILTDNGSPFASTALGRLSKLSVRWIRLGITPLLIQPGKPQQNGRHERMHRTLKDRACSKPATSCHEHQKQFDSFIAHFNRVRPHQALGGKPPERFYTPSSRVYPRRLPEIEYPAHVEVRRVRSSGEIKWQGQWLFVSEALIGERIGFEPIADGVWMLYFGPLDLGYYSEADRTLHLDRNRPVRRSCD
jgi:transposase InsO family protein